MIQHSSIGGIPIVLGGNVFGYTADEKASYAILDRFYEAGGRMVDSAQGYSVWVEGHVGGESETVLGKWLSSRGVRSDMLIHTKTGMFGRPGDLAPKKVREELEKSLERLQTGYVDLYYAHRDETETPLEQVADGFGSLHQEGLVKELGASNYGAARFRDLNLAAVTNGTAQFTVLQNEYNLVVRDEFDGELRAYCTQNSIAHLPWFGLAAGFLTGKYRTRVDLERHNRGSSIERFFERGLPVLPVLDTIAEETGASMGAIALAWLSAQAGITAPIASASNAQQLDLHFEAINLTLSPEHIELLTNSVK